MPKENTWFGFLTGFQITGQLNESSFKYVHENIIVAEGEIRSSTVTSFLDRTTPD